MMTQQLEVSILAAPLLAIDRRVLSQAWYAALRLKRDSPPESASRSQTPSRRSCVAPPRIACPAVRFGSAPARPGVAQRAHSAKQPRVSTEHECRRLREARAPRPPLARAIESAFARAPLRRATFSVGRGSARIHVVLQTKGNRTTLIALCRPHLSAAVARALAQARVALAARGIGIELRAQGGRRCF
ncbi:MAG TPA: hypothetical protein VIW73_04605 [Candidatus Cybelea sp.]